MAGLEAGLDATRLDLAAAKERSAQLSRVCADVGSQLSILQIEMKNVKCDDCHRTKHHRPPTTNGNDDDDSTANLLLRNEILPESSPSIDDPISDDDLHPQHPRTPMRHANSRALSPSTTTSTTVRRLDERLGKLERKLGLAARKRASLERRLARLGAAESRDQLPRRLQLLESVGRDLADKLRNVSRELAATESLAGDSAARYIRRLDDLEARLAASNRSAITATERRLADLEVSGARRAAELSRTRDDLGNLRQAVQALSVSASRLQERSDSQQASLERLANETVVRPAELAHAENLTKELEHAEDEYRLMIDSLPGNCEKRDGLTLLAPGPGAPLLAACRSGWIVVGRRVDGTVDFDRTWNEYALGFGSPLNEFWAGNEALHRLSRDNCTRLRIELNDIEGEYWVADYEDFQVGDEDSGYRLRLGGFTGNATDAMAYQNGMAFSARDRDLDISSTDCAANYHGGWWFSHCQHANLNGRYSLGLTWYRSDVNQWMAVTSTEISVRLKERCL